MNHESKHGKSRKAQDLLIAPLCEAALLLVVGAAGWISHQPFLFTSLGPTAYELIEAPHRESARSYSILVGHLVGVVSGYLALFLTSAWYAPSVSIAGVTPLRIWAAIIAAGLTVFGNLALRAGQPAALSTTLLISLGTMQRPRDALVIMGAVVLMNIAGQPLRTIRLGQDKAPHEHQLD